MQGLPGPQQHRPIPALESPSLTETLAVEVPGAGGGVGAGSQATSGEEAAQPVPLPADMPLPPRPCLSRWVPGLRLGAQPTRPPSCSCTRSSGSVWSWWAWKCGPARTRSRSAPTPAPRWITSWPGGRSTCWGGTPTTTPSSSREWHCATGGWEGRRQEGRRGRGATGVRPFPGVRLQTLLLFPAGSTSTATLWAWPRCPPCAPGTQGP